MRECSDEAGFTGQPEETQTSLQREWRPLETLFHLCAHLPGGRTHCFIKIHQSPLDPQLHNTSVVQCLCMTAPYGLPSGINCLSHVVTNFYLLLLSTVTSAHNFTWTGLELQYGPSFFCSREQKVCPSLHFSMVKRINAGTQQCQIHQNKWIHHSCDVDNFLREGRRTSKSSKD